MHVKTWNSAMAMALAALGSAAQAAQYSNTFTLQTQDQSLWSTGAQAGWAYDSGFIGGKWGTYDNRAPVAFGLNAITGSARAELTPYIAPIQISPYIPPVQISPYIPEVCLPWWLGGGCTPAVPAVFSPAVPAVFTPAVAATYGDTRTGASAGVQSSGRLGFNVKAGADGGSLDLSLPYQATLVAPAPDEFVAGRLLSIGANARLGGASIAVDAPSFKASVNGIADTTNRLSGAGCFFLAGCAESTTNANINKAFEILSLDTTRARPATALDGLLTLPVVLGQALPIKVGAQTVGNVTISTPSDQSGGTVSGKKVELSSNQTLLRTTADFAGIAQAALGVPLDVLQPSLDIAGLASIGATLINLQGGVNFGMSQLLSFEANVDVTLSFDQVMFDSRGVALGQSVTFDLGSSVDIMFKTRPGHMTYSFSIDTDESLFTNDTGISVDPLFAIRAGCFNLSIASGVVADIDECAFEDTYNTTDLLRASVYKKSFELEGFNVASFDVALVPEPKTYALLLAGLGVVGCAALRRRMA
jgi:opacity protein-like surface antigen